MHDINVMSRGKCLGPKQAQFSTIQLGLPDKGRAIKGFVVRNNCDLEPLDLLNGLVLGCYQLSPELLTYCTGLLLSESGVRPPIMLVTRWRVISALCRFNYQKFEFERNIELPPPLFRTLKHAIG